MTFNKHLLTGLALFVGATIAIGQPPEATPATPQTGQPAPGIETKADRASADSAAPAPKAGDRMEIEIAPGMKMAFRWCPPGKFVMGSPATEAGRSADETQHEVTLSNGFWLAETEVTQAQWRAVTSEEPTNFLGEKLPVQAINWYQAQYFVNSAKRPAGMTMRLPTEAEWEYACRAGTTTPFAYGNFMNGTEANMDGDYPYPDHHPKGPSRKKPIEVASFKPNAWGLHDMHGNVLEWCADWHGDFTSAPATDPTGPEKGEQRIARGSSWDDFGSQCRSACRNCHEPVSQVGDLGFRPVLSPSKQHLTDLALFVGATTAIARPPEATPAKAQTGQPAAGLETKADRASADSATPAPKAGDRMEIEIASGIKMAFRWCPPGKFMMGSPATEAGHMDNETQHEVTLSNGFWLAETEVTQDQWRAVTSEEPTGFLGDKLPVQEITWHQAHYFINLAKRPAGMTMRLPTEAEWEYACRAGTTTPFAYGNFMNGTEANIDGDNPQPYNHPKGPSRKKPIEVASFKPNAWGFHDMHGNVLEWCADWYGDFTSAPATDPTGPEKGEQRIVRGGSWDCHGSECRSAFRGRHYGTSDLGFRPALSPGK